MRKYNLELYNVFAISAYSLLRVYRLWFKENLKVFIKVMEMKGIEKSKVNRIQDDTIVLSVLKKKNYKLYMKEISKLKF